MTTISPLRAAPSGRHGRGADLRSNVAQRLWSTGVRDCDLVTELAESSRERFTDHAGSDDSDPHLSLLCRP